MVMVEKEAKGVEKARVVARGVPVVVMAVEVVMVEMVVVGEESRERVGREGMKVVLEGLGEGLEMEDEWVVMVVVEGDA